MLNINTNLTGLIVQSNLKSSTGGLNRAIERLSSGFKINHAKDNAANFAIANNISFKITSLSVAEENTAMGLELITTASESLSLIEERLSRLRMLQTYVENGTYGADSLAAINTECNSIVDEIEKYMVQLNIIILTFFSRHRLQKCIMLRKQQYLKN